MVPVRSGLCQVPNDLFPHEMGDGDRLLLLVVFLFAT